MLPTASTPVGKILTVIGITGAKAVYNHAVASGAAGGMDIFAIANIHCNMTLEEQHIALLHVLALYFVYAEAFFMSALRYMSTRT